MSPNDADVMANSVDPDQTAPLGAVWFGSALFAQAYLSENLGSFYGSFTMKLCFQNNGVDPGPVRSRLIWVCAVCLELSVQKLRIITVVLPWSYASKATV